MLPIASDADGYFTPILDDDEEETPAYDPAIRDHTLMTAMAHEKERVRRTKYPLQYALSLTAFCGDIPLEVSALYSIPKAPPIRETILKVSKETPELVRVRDEFGWTPLHAAASTGNYEALDILLSDEITGGTPWDLSDRENVSGRTPLECAESEIRGDKEFKATMLEFDQAPSGALDPQMKCVWRLKKEMGQDVGDVDEYIRKNRWGCTCGKCTGGWFSPRMRFRLQCKFSSLSHLV